MIKNIKTGLYFIKSQQQYKLIGLKYFFILNLYVYFCEVILNL
jgi:hypothetical protein